MVRHRVAPAAKALHDTDESLDLDITRNAESESKVYWKARKPERPGWSRIGGGSQLTETLGRFDKEWTNPQLQQEKETGVLRLPPATQIWTVHQNQEFERRQRRCLTKP